MHQAYEQGPPMQQTDSVNSGGRGVSPPDRKRLRRNSGSATPSPYVPVQQSMQYNPGQSGGQNSQQHQAALQQQQMQMHMTQAQAQAQMQNDPQVRLTLETLLISLNDGSDAGLATTARDGSTNGV